MNFKKALIEDMIKTGELKPQGDLIFNEDPTNPSSPDELLFDFPDLPVNPVDTTIGSDALGNYGPRNDFFCRANVHIDDINKRFADSKKLADRQAAAVAPQYFMTISEGENLSDWPSEMEALFRHNHDLWLMSRGIYPLMNLDNTQIRGCWFISWGNGNFPDDPMRKKPGKMINAAYEWAEFRLKTISDAFARTRDPINDPK